MNRDSDLKNFGVSKFRPEIWIANEKEKDSMTRFRVIKNEALRERTIWTIFCYRNPVFSIKIISLTSLVLVWVRFIHKEQFSTIFNQNPMFPIKITYFVSFTKKNFQQFLIKILCFLSKLLTSFHLQRKILNNFESKSCVFYQNYLLRYFLDISGINVTSFHLHYEYSRDWYNFTTRLK